MTGLYVKLGDQLLDEDHQTTLLRGKVYSLMVTVKDPQVLEKAKAQFEAHISEIIPITPDQRQAVYSAIAAGNDNKAYDRLFQLYRETDLNEENNRIALSLGASKDKAQIQKLIQFAMSEHVRKQDSVLFLYAISKNNKVGRDMVWNHFKMNIKIFKAKYETLLLSRLVKIPENFATAERLKEVAAFFDSNPIEGSELAVKQTLESIKLNADWLARDSQIMRSYLTKSIQL